MWCKPSTLVMSFSSTERLPLRGNAARSDNHNFDSSSFNADPFLWRVLQRNSRNIYPGPRISFTWRLLNPFPLPEFSLRISLGPWGQSAVTSEHQMASAHTTHGTHDMIVFHCTGALYPFPLYPHGITGYSEPSLLRYTYHQSLNHSADADAAPLSISILSFQYYFSTIKLLISPPGFTQPMSHDNT